MKFIPSVLRGIGQVLFQNNSYSGILFLSGIFYNSWLFGLAALLGTVISILSAHLLNYSKDDIQNGLYGFNGTLTGIAVFCFFELSYYSIFACIIGAFLSTWVMYALKKILPPFTAPFVLVTWFIIYFLMLVLNLPLLSSSVDTETTLNVTAAISKSFGQVMFQENIVTGILFFLGILINAKRMAVYAVYAAALGSLTGWLLIETSSVNAGLMGYNAILCAIALSGKERNDFLWVTLAIICSTLLNIGLGITGIITLTAPFVIVTWVIWKLKQLTQREKLLA